MTRFALLTDLPPTTARAEQLRLPTRVSWSLISANNRPLGRAASTFSSIEACTAAIEELGRQLELATSSVVLGDPDSGRRAYWTWGVQADGKPIAVAAFRYARRFECEGSLQRFLTAVPQASAAAPAIIRVGHRFPENSP